MRIHIAAAVTGNLMFRHMFARALRKRRPAWTIHGAGLREWGIPSDPEPPPEPVLRTGPHHRIDIDALIRTAETGGYASVLVDAYAQRLEYFEADRDFHMRRFKSPALGQVTADDEIVLCIRAGDALAGVHRGYMPVPVRRYQNIVHQTGLKPVLIGQLDPSPYADALRQAFPRARILRGRAPLDDFQTVRHARHIALAVSTFHWLAAWLSPTAERIFLPVSGILSPRQRPDIDLLPRNDPRYEFLPFRVENYTATPEQLARILAVNGEKAGVSDLTESIAQENARARKS